MEFWGRHRHVMSPIPGDESAWQCTKVGPGPIPIKTEEGWLLIYHGVITTCNGRKNICWHRMNITNVWAMFPMWFSPVQLLRTRIQEELRFIMDAQTP